MLELSSSFPSDKGDNAGIDIKMKQALTSLEMTGIRGVGVKIAGLLGLMLKTDALMPLPEEELRHTEVLLQ